MDNENYINNLSNKHNVIVEIINGTSKKGNQYKALKVTIGEYETLVFPSKFEMKYIESVL